MQVRVIIIGLGNVGRRLLELLERKRAMLRGRVDLEFLVIAAADSSGGRIWADGADLRELIVLKTQGKKIAQAPDGGHASARNAAKGDAPAPLDPLELTRTVDANLLVELTPTNLKSGEPGLTFIRAALARKLNVVTANKGPLVLAYQELMDTANLQGVQLLHSATVTGGLPTLNLGRRDLGACEFTGFEGIVNATTNYILTRMGEGESFDAALRHAQEVGHAEADPSLDVDGWDAANKLVIIANAVLRRPTRLDEVRVAGIRGVTAAELREARANGQVIKLLARAERLTEGNGDFRFSVKPTRLDADHPLARVNADMMGVIYHTDINGTIFASIEERDPYPTAAAVLRDMINVSV
jgi:homoserine dehydrogenase